MLPPEDIYPLKMSVGEGMKMLISGGAVIPHTAAETLKNECNDLERPSSSNDKVSTSSKEKMG
jgi:uncharacterized membrane protein